MRLYEVCMVLLSLTKRGYSTGEWICDKERTLWKCCEQRKIWRLLKNESQFLKWRRTQFLREFEIIFRMFVRRNVGILSYDFGRTPCSSISQNQSLPFTHRCSVSGHGQQRQKSNSSQYWHSKLALSSKISWNWISLVTEKVDITELFYLEKSISWD